MRKNTVKISKNVKETAEIAKTFLNEILKGKNNQKSALVVGLSGDLGAGKTAFVQAAAKHLGIRNKINSPTFVIMKKYPVPEQARYGVGPLPRLRGSTRLALPKPSAKRRRARGSGFRFLFHIDAYRLKNEKELLPLGWEEIISNKEHLVFIEWPENVSKIIPADARFVYISHTKDGHRNLKLK